MERREQARVTNLEEEVDALKFALLQTRVEMRRGQPGEAAVAEANPVEAEPKPTTSDFRYGTGAAESKGQRNADEEAPDSEPPRALSRPRAPSRPPKVQPKPKQPVRWNQKAPKPSTPPRPPPPPPPPKTQLPVRKESRYMDKRV